MLKELECKITDTISVMETQNIKIKEPSDNGTVVVVARQIARKIGLKITDEFLVATSASELATNIVRYGIYGEITINRIKCIRGQGIEIVAKDYGPGIENVYQAIENKFTTTEKSLGMGLPSVLRIMDEFVIDTVLEQGTEIRICKWNWS